MADLSWIRITGLFKNKTKPNMLTGVVKGGSEQVQKMFDEVKKVIDNPALQLNFTMFKNDAEAGKPIGTLTMKAGEPAKKGEYTKKEKPKSTDW